VLRLLAALFSLEVSLRIQLKSYDIIKQSNQGFKSFSSSEKNIYKPRHPLLLIVNPR